jgi:DNA-binding NtrC family response regulator
MPKSSLKFPLLTLNSLMEKVNVLIVEDNPDYLSLMERVMKNNSLFEIKTANDLASTMKVLNEGSIDLLILDLTLPDSNAENTLEVITSLFPYVATIVMTGDSTLLQDALTAGVQNFIVKGEFDYEAFNHACKIAIPQLIAKISNENKNKLNQIIQKLEHMQSYLDKI